MPSIIAMRELTFIKTEGCLLPTMWSDVQQKLILVYLHYYFRVIIFFVRLIALTISFNYCSHSRNSILHLCLCKEVLYKKE